ncbi:amino acid ABC transporter substrate-binding protein [Halocalculus aciditolerans]|uniref:Amino acid ABC transporter substrate-binding protein n=1 Tax=Halocalculus aciditolerans TaxID=1383812 RepID=A0A830FA23_9EURY|nr:amino acid ABC transporter substrate-binding protein [Halocalculus aciditolerans]
MKLGLLFPETGDLGSLGKPMRDAGELAAIIVNDADVDITVDTQSEDTQTDPSQGVSAANSLVNAGYPMVNGPASSGVNLPVCKQVFIPNNVVGSSPSSTAPSVTSLDDNDLVYRTAPSDALQGRVLAQIAYERQEDRTASTMFVNNDYGQQLSDAFVGAFEDKGGTVQQTVSFEKGQSSYTSRLQSALSGNPDTLIVVGYPESGVQLFKDYYSNFSGEHNILLTDGMAEASMPSKVGNPMDNAKGSAPLPSGPANDFFTQQYKDEYGSEPTVFTPHSFDSAMVMILANAHAGENTGSAVKESMRMVANPADGATDVGPDNIAEGISEVLDGNRVNYSGASSSVDFDENGDMSAVTYQYWGFGDGVIETLAEIQFDQ